MKPFPIQNKTIWESKHEPSFENFINVGWCNKIQDCSWKTSVQIDNREFCFDVREKNENSLDNECEWN